MQNEQKDKDRTEHHIDIADTIPSAEPKRQYYFIEQLKKTVKEKSERLGRPLSYKVVTFGCQMNARDSEKLRGILEMVGMSRPKARGGFRPLQYMYCAGECQSEGIRTAGISKQREKKSS